MFKNLPTMLWVIGAAVTVAAFSPAVGNVATNPRVVVVQPPQRNHPQASRLRPRHRRRRNRRQHSLRHRRRRNRPMRRW